MAWFKRSRGRKNDAERVEAVHPVYGLRVGMDRSRVLDRLGPPPKSMTSEELSADYKVVAGAKPSSGKEFWLYEDVPPGHDIQVVITAGVLDSVEVKARPTSDSSSGRAATRTVTIAKDGIHASTPPDAAAVLSTIIDELPPIDQARLQADSEVLRQKWGGLALELGSIGEIGGLLRAALDRDATLPGHSDILLQPMLDRACAQVVSIIDVPGKPVGRAIAYRIWLTTDGRLALVRPAASGSRP